VYPGNNTFNGVQLLRPDCSICTLPTPPPGEEVRIVGDVYGGGWGTPYGIGWVDMFSQTEYDMNVDPNTCHHAAYRDAYPYSPYNVFYGYLFPVEWEKTGEKYCSPGTCSNVRDCDGNPYAPESGTVGTWKPAFAPWSKLAAEYCP
jgi:hypothetical protein